MSDLLLAVGISYSGGEILTVMRESTHEPRHVVLVAPDRQVSTEGQRLSPQVSN